MKQIIPVLFLLAAWTTGCKNEEKTETTTETPIMQRDTTVPANPDTVRKDIALAEPVKLDTACITGTFKDKSEAALLVNPRTIVLNRDGTGEDVYTLEDRRPIRWTLKDGKLYIHAKGELRGSRGTEVYINCKAKELSVYGFTFGKN